ncbi:MAG TPA: MgtC/SapB family protein [Pseudomonas sp.]|jgi:putative Mg2+ transporter-C (MgtC) family protein|nr:MgtC/SapB family protein [Pseudomonas sp.]
MGAWASVVETLSDELGSILDPEQITRIVLRLGMAAIFGAVLGYEREHHGKAAGIRTHMMVAVGSALFVLAPEFSGSHEDALSRVIQGVVAGVGFLCAGTILKGETARGVIGLTTAAGVWLTAAIGIACGLGSAMLALLGTLLGLFILNIVPRLVDRSERNTD